MWSYLYFIYNDMVERVNQAVYLPCLIFKMRTLRIYFSNMVLATRGGE